MTDQYCAIENDANVANTISSVVVDEIDIFYDQTKSDYSQTAIALTDPGKTVITITSEIVSTHRSTTWKVWIDLNDNGVFADDDVVANTFVAAAQPYGRNIALDLSTLANDGTEKYMRIIGDYALISPCNAGTGEALDLQVTW